MGDVGKGGEEREKVRYDYAAELSSATTRPDRSGPHSLSHSIKHDPVIHVTFNARIRM